MAAFRLQMQTPERLLFHLKFIIKAMKVNHIQSNSRKNRKFVNAGAYSLIHLSNLINIGSELLHDGGWLQNLCFLAKTQHPAEKLIADLNLCGNGEMSIIQLFIPHAALVVAETIHNRIQKRIDKTDHNTRLLASKHGEDTLGVGFQVDCGKGFCALSWLAGEADIFHTIHAVGSHVLRVIIKRQQIIVAVVDKQLVGTDRVFLPFAALHLLSHVADGVFQILEADLLGIVRLAIQTATHGIVDGADIVKHRFIGGLHTICQKGIVPDLLCLMLADKLANYICKAVGLSL